MHDLVKIPHRVSVSVRVNKEYKNKNMKKYMCCIIRNELWIATNGATIILSKQMIFYCKS